MNKNLTWIRNILKHFPGFCENCGHRFKKVIALHIPVTVCFNAECDTFAIRPWDCL